MKTTNLNTNTIEAMFKQLKFNFGGTITKASKEYILDIKNEIGNGNIKGIALQGGISYIEFDMAFSDDVVVSVDTPNKNPIYFAYCSEGSLGHSFGANEKKRTLENFQTGILTSQLGDVNKLYFNKNERSKITLISVQTSNRTKANGKDNLKGKLLDTFFNEDAKENFVYIGSQNLKIAEKIQQLNAIKQKGIVGNLLVQGLVHVILALEIQQHAEDKHRQIPTGSLTMRDMELIKKASQFVKNNYHKQLSIPVLCLEFGISPSKLQEGFKGMHGRTVAEYIREVRVLKAEELIKTTDLNISEIVYSIGFSSRSYFSKIFKEKYNCNPKDYKDAQKVSPISA
ncbi:helix-turn-helix domain-containing protein [Jejuia pallidilutea]|uniref:DNA-binding response regulator n=1 Tax=Jejuia pallidilutea TaxID=504487 RepID=A0A090VXA0_9FLAO|nr:AraC family transcriptional regulator [Jejuia pallidilutea]GAL68568.1 DNA-binding response regulator [Jejuia pallidilutea]GAL72776.1 DNA-binding response regulator [Jejuia pallidilutea]GAL90160.1 DNA-binding response regulator [Jejuia pallidilutea]